MKAIKFILAVLVLVLVVSCQTTKGPPILISQSGEKYEKGVSLETNVKELSLIVIEKSDPIGIHTIDGISHYNMWNGWLNGRIYITPGERIIGYGFKEYAGGGVEYTGFKYVKTLFEPGKIYFATVNFDLSSKTFDITYKVSILE